MADSQEDLSPEEKLLRAMQKSSDDDDSSESADPDDATQETASQESDEDADKPKLRVARKNAPEPAEVTEQTDGSDSADEEEQPDDADSKPSAAARPAPGPAAVKVSGEGISILKLVNRCLGLLVLVVLALVAFEVFANTQTPAEPVIASDAAQHIQLADPADTDLPALETVLAEYNQRPLLEHWGPEPPPVNGGTGTQPKQLPPWEQTARNNFDLLGTSPLGDGRMEAIIVDRRDQKMHFLQIGDKIMIEEREITLREIQQDQVIFTDGTAKVPVK